MNIFKQIKDSEMTVSSVDELKQQYSRYPDEELLSLWRDLSRIPGETSAQKVAVEGLLRGRGYTESQGNRPGEILWVKKTVGNI